MKTFCKNIFLFSVLSLILILTQLSPASAKNPVTKPFQISAQSTVLDFTIPPYPMMFLDQGVASEIGRFVLTGKLLEPGSGFGIIYAANGDQIFWEEQGGVLEFKGGTGQFENVTGGFEYNIVSFELAPGPAGTTTFIFTYTGEGTITY
jgi:hypothetical protein